MDNDDAPVGRVLSRREMIALLGTAGTALFLNRAGVGTNAASSASPRNAATSNQSARSCVVRPELTEGPFFVEEGLNRSDIRSDPKSKIISAGVPLELVLNVSQVGDACAALAGATVDIWHCDALGRYSDVDENGTLGQKFLRGSQVTNAQGVARFTTIYPGWYEGRATHIHFKIRTAAEGKTHEFTSQFFFDDALTDKIYAAQPYTQNAGRRQKNNEDGIFEEGGSQLILSPQKTKTGYAARFDIGIDLSKAGSSGRGPGGGPGRGGPPRGGFGALEEEDGPPPDFRN